MIKKFMLATLILISGNSYAENIDNIFGFKLGEEINHEKVIFIEQVKNKKKSIYKINFKGFETATISYTPTSKKIYQIETEKEIGDKDSCTYELDVILGIMSKKYGDFENLGIINEKLRGLEDTDKSLYNYYSIFSKEKYLTVGCESKLDEKYFISIKLKDNSIKDIAKQEQIEKESEYELKNL